MSDITLNGCTFAPGKSAALNSLFTGTKTATGWYTVRGKQVTLFNLRGERFGGINSHRVAHWSTKGKDGKWWHQCAPSWQAWGPIPAWPEPSGYTAMNKDVYCAYESATKEVL
jgi:hypothetical protein